MPQRNAPRAARRQRRRQATPPLISLYRPSNTDTTLDVVIYHRIDQRDPRHWAIYILSPRREGSIHQIFDDIGGRGYYVAPVRLNVQPQQARLHRVSVFVGRIRWRNLGYVRRFVQQWRENNRSDTWNCQSWVMEIVWALARADLLEVRWRGLRRVSAMREHWQ